MLLLEYQAKRQLARSGIHIPRGECVDDASVFSGEAVLKVQVPVGGRGKQGGVVKIRDEASFVAEVARLSRLSIDGHAAEAVLAEELVVYEREHYVSILMDRGRQAIVLVARVDGGVDVETSDAEVFIRPIASSEAARVVASELREFLGYAGEMDEEFARFTAQLFDCFVETDALLLEINPLVVVDGELVALDCKLEVDDNALYRQRTLFASVSGEVPEEPRTQNANFVLLDEQGDTAVVANGAGLAMATVDQINQAGLRSTNFLDVGGGADTDMITRQFERLVKLPRLRAIIVNIFAGITQCDQVARAIVAARDHIDGLPPLYIRLHGTNYAQAKVILDTAGVGLYESLGVCIAAAQAAGRAEARDV